MYYCPLSSAPWGPLGALACLYLPLCPPMADTNRVLSDLHADLAYHLKSKLDDGSISTSELNILRQFLKDNGISAQPVAGTGFGDLVASLPDMDKIVQMPRRKAA